MTTLQIHDKFITTLLQTKFHNDKTKFIEAIKVLLKENIEHEIREYNLLKAYDDGELSIGQIAKFLNISKSETIELLKKYDIPFIKVDKEYLEYEFNAFN